MFGFFFKLPKSTISFSFSMIWGMGSIFMLNRNHSVKVNCPAPISDKAQSSQVTAHLGH